MKTIAELTTDLVTNLRNTRNAIIGRGGKIAADAGFSAIPAAIASIPADSSTSEYIDDTTALTKVVPTNSIKYCYINKLGGMSRKCNNLVDQNNPYATNARTATSNGNTYKQDGWNVSQIIPITPSKNYCHNLSVNSYCAWFDKDRKYIEGFTIEPNKVKWAPSNAYYIRMDFPQGVDVMLAQSDTVPTYEPYFDGLRDTKVTEIVSEGVNLFDESQIKYATTRNGVQADDWGIVEDGVLIAKKGIYSGTLQWKPFGVELDAGTYAISCDCYVSTGGAPNLQVRFGVNTIEAGSSTIYANGVTSLSNYDTWERKTGTITITKKDTYYLCLMGSGNASQNSNMDVRFKNICVTKGTTVFPYKPYIGTIGTTIIPEAIQNLDGYGCGVNATYYNYIDFERKVFVQKTKRLVFNGTEPWQNSDTMTADAWRKYVEVTDRCFSEGTSTIPPIVCNHYETASASNNYSRKQSIATNKWGFYVYDSAYDTDDVSLWKAHLAELYASGNPLVVEYALETPIEIPIDIPDALIAVEGGGTLTFANEHNYDVPSTVTYQILTN